MQNSAGVYTKEIDLSQRADPASTSTGAIVGMFEKGEVGKRILITDEAELERLFGIGNVKKYGYATFLADIFLKQSKQLYVTRLVNGALTAGAYLTVDSITDTKPKLNLSNFDDGSNVPLGKEDPLNTLGFDPSDSSLENTLLYFCAANPGIWNNKISIRIRPSNPAGTAAGSGSHNVGDFFVDVFYDYTGPNNIPVETFFVSREYKLDGSGNQMYVEEAINNFSSYIRVKNNTRCPNVGIYEEVFEFLDGGTDGARVNEGAIMQGWDLYSDPETLDVQILISSGYDSPEVNRKIDSIARNRGDAVAVLNVPDSDYHTARAVDYRRNRLNVNSSYSGLYSPYVQIRDTNNNKSIFIPPSGHVAAAYAYTDNQRAVWFAPAGLSRGKVRITGIRKKYNHGERDALDRANINPVRFMAGRGYVIMGQETLQSTKSALSNINVRRLLNYIKKTCSRSIMFGIFDPNDVFLRSQITVLIERFLESIKSGQGLYDYSVVCDERNNKPYTIANGDLIVDVYVDPIIPAKRIHLTAFINPTGSRFAGDY